MGTQILLHDAVFVPLMAVARLAENLSWLQRAPAYIAILGHEIVSPPSGQGILPPFSATGLPFLSPILPILLEKRNTSFTKSRRFRHEMAEIA
jgi:hypothetical protein